MEKYFLKMFFILTAFAFITFCSTEARSQEKDNPTNKGTFIMGNVLNFTYSAGSYYEGTDSKGKKYTPWSLTLNPSVEYFCFNKIAFGGTFKYVYESKGSDTEQVIGLGPIISFYAGFWTTVIPYISIFALYDNYLLNVGSTKSMYWADKVYSGGAKLGIIFMMSRQAGLTIEAQGAAEMHTQDKTQSGGTGSETKTGYTGTGLIGIKYFIF